MIVVKVELWPHGDESKARELSRAFISNDLKTTAETRGEYGSYECKFMQSQQFNPSKVWKKSRAKFIHRTKRGVWDILFVGLYNAGLLKRNSSAVSTKDEV